MLHFILHNVLKAIAFLVPERIHRSQLSLLSKELNRRLNQVNCRWNAKVLSSAEFADVMKAANAKFLTAQVNQFKESFRPGDKIIAVTVARLSPKATKPAPVGYALMRNKVAKRLMLYCWENTKEYETLNYRHKADVLKMEEQKELGRKIMALRREMSQRAEENRQFRQTII